MNDHPVTFPQWKAALAEAALPPATKAVYGREIIASSSTQNPPGSGDRGSGEAVSGWSVQELLGHASVETTQIYTHVMHPASPKLRRARKPGLGVRSPLDA